MSSRVFDAISQNFALHLRNIWVRQLNSYYNHYTDNKEHFANVNKSVIVTLSNHMQTRRGNGDRT